MERNKYRVIGVMSGTSLDGIDLVLVEFQYGEKWTYEIINSETVSYDNIWVKTLKGLVSLSLDALKMIDVLYTEYLAKVIADFVKKYKIEDIDVICSHGHTALHQPKKGVTYQIGNMDILSKCLKTKVVCDFRVQDVALGGQGAPLVPIGDKLLFSEYDFCLNLGGFANISTDFNGERIAYDICPVNIVLNHYVKNLGFSYDDRGEIASAGTINKGLLAKLNGLHYYKNSYPKSLGLEWVKKEVFPIIDAFKISIKDILRTFTEHIAIQLSAEINKKNVASVLITGGGVYNAYLIERLRSMTCNKIVLPDNDLIEMKEAVIFGFLGVLRIRNEINCLKSVTGAVRDHSSGVVYLP